MKIHSTTHTHPPVTNKIATPTIKANVPYFSNNSENKEMNPLIESLVFFFGNMPKAFGHFVAPLAGEQPKPKPPTKK